MTVCFDRGSRSPELLVTVLDADFDLLTTVRARAPDLPGTAFSTVTGTDDRSQAGEYNLVDTTAGLDITDGPRKAQQVILRQATRPGPVGPARPAP